MHSLRVVRSTRTGVLLSHFPEVSRHAGVRSLCREVVRWRGLVALVVLLFGARVDAQGDGLLLVSDADVPAAVERSVKRRLGQVSELLDVARYNTAARNAGMPPASDAALTKVAARSGAALIVHLCVDEAGGLEVELRQGSSGAVLATPTFPLQGRRLKQPARALHQLVAAAREQLSARVQPTADEPELAEAPEPAPAPRPSVAVEDASPAQSSSADEEIMEDPELSARLQASSDESESGPRQGLALQASVGFGPGVHALDVVSPVDGSSSRLDTGLAPAASLAASAQLGLGQWLLRAEAQYRTFLGSESALPADANTMSGLRTQASETRLTSHSFVIGASPGYRFGGRDSVALLLMLGWTYRSLHEAEGLLPGVSLTGFVARPALHVPFGDGVFCLRFAPELVVVQQSETNARGFMPSQASGGIGWGAEAGLDVRLAKLLSAGLQYRRSRISATRTTGQPAVDEEWYVSIHAALTL
jgi:hypothetical protein